MLKSLTKDDNEAEQQTDERITECLICGKLFPRGPIDLARHGAAITLKHIFSDKRSASFPFGCKKCTSYFTSKEHLEMHCSKSRCNPTVVAERIEEAIKLEFELNAAIQRKAQKNDSEEISGTKRNGETDSDKEDNKNEKNDFKNEKENDDDRMRGGKENENEEQLEEKAEEKAEEKGIRKVLSTVQKKELRSAKEIISAGSSIASNKIPRNLSSSSTLTSSATVGIKSKNDNLRKDIPSKELFKETSFKNKIRNNSGIVTTTATTTATGNININSNGDIDIHKMINTHIPSATVVVTPVSHIATSSLIIPGKATAN